MRLVLKLLAVGASPSPAQSANQAATSGPGLLPILLAILIVVLAVGAVAIFLALVGVPYRQVTGPAFIAAMLVILVAARTDRRSR